MGLRRAIIEAGARHGIPTVADVANILNAVRKKVHTDALRRHLRNDLVLSGLGGVVLFPTRNGRDAVDVQQQRVAIQMEVLLQSAPTLRWLCERLAEREWAQKQALSDTS